MSDYISDETVTTDLRAARAAAIALRKQRPDLARQATDLIKCIEYRLKAPNDPALVAAYKARVREIEGRI